MPCSLLQNLRVFYKREADRDRVAAEHRRPPDCYREQLRRTPSL